MKLYHKLIYPFFLLFTGVLLIYSYVLIDPNLTLFNTRSWTFIRNYLIQFGYYQRETSSYVFIVLVIIAFCFHWYFVKKHREVSVWKIIVPLMLLGAFSYPLLSHDFFNYMFDAKILTFYHANPYVTKALNFPGDSWLRFMHWTHRTYPYGPTYLPITIIPSALSFGKFILDFYLFKMTSVLFYLLGVWSLYKLNKKWAIFFATNPLVIFEGLISSHNDLIGVSLALIGLSYLFNNRRITSRIFFLLSIGIKYVTAPLILVSKNKKHIVNKVSLGLLIVALVFLSFKQEIQPWYFLALLPFIVFFENLIYELNIFFAGLLFSYFPYIRFGEWDAAWKITLKHNIVFGFLVVNLVFYFLKKSKMKFFIR